MRQLTSLTLAVGSLLGLTVIGAPSAIADDASAAALECGYTFGNLSNISIQSARTGNFVSAELNYEGGNYGMLRARAASDGGSWEKFQLWTDTAAREITLRNLGNDRLVAAEINTSGENEAMLRARTTGTAGSWERFVVCYDFDTGYWSFHSVANGLFVSAEANYTGYNANVLRARSFSVSGSWERFNVYSVSATGGATALSPTKVTLANVVPPS